MHLFQDSLTFIMFRGHAAYAVPGVGLALCGVGYSLEGDAHKDVMIPVEPHFQSVINYYQQQAKSTKERLLDQDSDIERDEDEDQQDGSRKRKLSRRERYQQKMKKNNNNYAISIDHLIPSHPATPNTQNLQAFLSDGSVTSFSSLLNIPFENELMSKDGELLYYPQRSFHFPQVGRDIVLTQSYSQIASTIWDAEVVLAHFLDQYKFSKETNSSHGEEGKSILVELGAGVGLAGMVASLKQYFNKVILQEIDEEAVQYMKERINEFKSSSNLKDSLNCEVAALPCLWGDEGVADIVKRIERSRNERIEWIVMADVLYHQEDFQSLLTTVKGLLLEGGNVLLAFEQRRKDVSAFLLQLRSLFRSCHVNEYAIKRDETITRIYLCHFEYFLS